jgi:hypothetical protein
MTVETDWAAWTASGERGRKTDSFKSDLLDRQDGPSALLGHRYTVSVPALCRHPGIGGVDLGGNSNGTDFRRPHYPIHDHYNDW